MKGHPTNLSLVFFNLTNPIEVQNGAVPIVKAVGPYTWAKNKKKLGLVFQPQEAVMVPDPADKTKQVQKKDSKGQPVWKTDARYVEYNDFTQYQYQPDNLLSQDDKITMINPFYAFTLSRIPGSPNEAGLYGALAYMVMGQFLATQLAANGNNPIPVAVAYLAQPSPFLQPLQASTPINQFALLSLWFPGNDAQGKPIPYGLVDPALPAVARVANVGAFMTSAATMRGLQAAGATAQLAAVLADFKSKYTLFCASAGSDSTAILQAYALYQHMDLTAKGAYAAYSNPASAALQGMTALGPVVTKTAREWAFGKPEFLLATLLQLTANMTAADAREASGSLTAFFGNKTDEVKEAAKTGVSYRFQTGKYNASLIGQYMQYEGKVSITSYPKQIPVRGTTGTVNGMNLVAGQDLLAFVTQVQRTLLLSSSSSLVDVKGVPTIRFTLKDNETNPNPDYDVRYKAVFNISATTSGSPLALTKPYFLDAPAELNLTSRWAQRAPAADVDDTIIFVEPRTGLALKGNLRLQINAYQPRRGAYNVFNPNMFASAATGEQDLLPLVAADENAVVSDDDAAKLKNALAKAKSAPAALAGVLIGVGALMLIFGGLCCWRIRVKHLREKETPVLQMTDLDKK